VNDKSVSKLSENAPHQTVQLSTLTGGHNFKYFFHLFTAKFLMNFNS